MQHTQQQRQGGPRYGPGVLIGGAGQPVLAPEYRRSAGHYEDAEQQRAALRSLLSTSAGGSLKLTQWQQRVATATAPATLTTLRRDGAVHYGDLLQLAHAPSGGVLAINVHDRDVPATAAATGGGDASGACAASLTGSGPAAAAPMARTTLLLSRYAPLRPSPLEPQWDADEVRYGQKLMLVANPAARGELLDAAGGSAPLYLASEPLGPTCAAKYCRHQAVYWTPCPSYACVWMTQPLEHTLRIALAGTPVGPRTPLLLVHAATGTPLAWEGSTSFPTDYGREHEVSAHAAMAAGMQQGLEHVARGDALRTLPKRSLPANHFCFIAGTAEGALPPGNGPLYDLNALLEAIARDVGATPGGLAALDRKLLVLSDTAGDMDAADLQLALRGCGASEASAGEGPLCALVAEYPGGRPGRVAARVLMAALAQQSGNGPSGAGPAQ